MKASIACTKPRDLAVGEPQPGTPSLIDPVNVDLSFLADLLLGDYIPAPVSSSMCQQDERERKAPALWRQLSQIPA